ncbi:CD209 antigen-like protein E [Nematolebias whitei]|uniref:CD209 antigen-like protein E n=1 Tax=Nematolebias whitei TaxID=451745 RepID=UPI001897F5EB|nr:CD209 antigen-like protein E [Nematolebias whitei]
MESQDQIYVNLEELDYHKPPQVCAPAGDKPLKTESVAGRETESGGSIKVLAVCLGLLSFILLVSVVAVAVSYNRDVHQLTGHLANQTAEWRQLLIRHQNLTHERDWLNVSLEVAEVKLDRLRKSSVTCPDGWRRFGCHCYLLSSTRDTWESSRHQCSGLGADLVIVNSQKEMMFLNNLGTQLKFWIALRQSYAGSPWTWTDGASPGEMFWQAGQPQSLVRPFKTQNCAAFNSFSGVLWFVQSWSSEPCSQFLQWVCEKQADSSELLI